MNFELTQQVFDETKVPVTDVIALFRFAMIQWHFVLIDDEADEAYRDWLSRRDKALVFA